MMYLFVCLIQVSVNMQEKEAVYVQSTIRFSANDSYASLMILFVKSVPTFIFKILLITQNSIFCYNKIRAKKNKTLLLAQRQYLTKLFVLNYLEASKQRKSTKQVQLLLRHSSSYFVIIACIFQNKFISLCIHFYKMNNLTRKEIIDLLANTTTKKNTEAAY